jgi:uncharacterized phosphosugar-binding protein
MVNQQVLLLNVKLGQSVCERLVVVVVLKDLRLEDSRVFSGNQMSWEEISDYGCESNQIKEESMMMIISKKSKCLTR